MIWKNLRVAIKIVICFSVPLLLMVLIGVWTYSVSENVQEKAEQVKAGEELVAFQDVFSLLSLYEKETVGQATDDVAFLKEQLGVIEQIAKIKDKERSQELVDMLLEDGEELPETAQFKVTVEQDCAEAKEGFAMMVNDIKDAFAEDGIVELKRMLEAHRAEITEESDEACESNCSSCSGCNIFKDFEKEVDDKKE